MGAAAVAGDEPLEIVATFFGLPSVWCYVKEHVRGWPTGLFNVALPMVLFWNQKLYAEAAQARIARELAQGGLP